MLRIHKILYSSFKIRAQGYLRWPGWKSL